MCGGVHIHYFKINFPLSAVNYFLKIISTLQDQQNSIQTYCRLPIIIFLWTPKDFSPESFLNFLLNLYVPPWLWKSLKFIVLRLLQIHLWIKKLNLFIFTPAPKQKSPSGFYHYPQGRREWRIPPEQRFLKIFFPEQKEGERIMELKKLPKLTRVLVTSFDKFHHLCNLYIFGLCFVVQ